MLHARAEAEIEGRHEENIEDNSLDLLSSSGQVIWSYDQTICLIDSMAVHMSDLNDPRKRKNVFENIANDLLSAGYTITATHAQNKWKSLTRSYKKAKDTKNRTGQGPSRFLFFDKIEDILGNKPSNKCSHSVNSMDIENKQPETKQLDKNIEILPGTSTDSELTENTENKKRKKSVEKIDKKHILELKKEEHKKKQIRHEELIALERERLAIERQKLHVIEQFLAQKKE